MDSVRQRRMSPVCQRLDAPASYADCAGLG
jgi:hypothetical protein